MTTEEERLRDAAPELFAALVQIYVALDVELPAGMPVPGPLPALLVENVNHWDVGRDAMRKALGLPM